MLRKRKVNGVGPLDDFRQNLDRVDFPAQPNAFNGKISSKPRILRKSVSLQDEPLCRQLSPKSPSAPHPYDHFITSASNLITEENEGDKSHHQNKSVAATNLHFCKCGRSSNRTHLSYSFTKNTKTWSHLKKSASFSYGYTRNITNECMQCGRLHLGKDTSQVSSISTPPIPRRNLKQDLKVN